MDEKSFVEHYEQKLRVCIVHYMQCNSLAKLDAPHFGSPF